MNFYCYGYFVVFVCLRVVVIVVYCLCWLFKTNSFLVIVGHCC